jgi:flagellar hook-basal body complex protein FliE
MAIGPLAPIAPVTPSLSTAGIGATSATGAAGAAGATGAAAGAGATGADFSNLLSRGLDNLQSTQARADDLAVQAATGTLADVHEYMIAATQAQLTTQLTVAVRNKALESFNEIMRMQA